jgi:hypothetical protein
MNLKQDSKNFVLDNIIPLKKDIYNFSKTKLWASSQHYMRVYTSATVQYK